MKLPPRIALPTPHGSWRALDAHLSAVVWTGIVAYLLLMSVLKDHLLPVYFFYDAGTIDTIIKLGAHLTAGDSYSSTAAMFDLFGFRRWSPMLPVVTGTVVLLSLLAAVWRAKRIRLHELAVYAFFGLLSVVYMTTLSKDFIVLLLVIAFASLSARGSRFGLAIWIGLAVLYAFYFRTYWFFVIAEYLVLRLWVRRAASAGAVVPAIALSLLLIAALLSWKLGIDADAFRTTINDSRIEAGDTNAHTMILPFVSGSGFVVGYLNVCLTCLTLIVPLPILATFSPYYIAIFIFLCALQYGFWSSFRQIARCRDKPFALDCCCLIASFMTIQSLFEPDYGSYVRHLAPLYPLYFFVWLCHDRTRPNHALSMQAPAMSSSPSAQTT